MISTMLKKGAHQAIMSSKTDFSRKGTDCHQLMDAGQSSAGFTNSDTSLIQKHSLENLEESFDDKFKLISN